VKLARYCALTGETGEAVHCRRKAGKWVDGVHCQIVERSLWINLEAVGDWLEHGTPAALDQLRRLHPRRRRTAAAPPKP
jgi:hypothetical protein